ncbi:MAG: hypothetical protein KDD70_08830 [Bdellovibrionales bacterium]|nr:hypothetical protein [Bdellovibrionales bacterium]
MESQDLTTPIFVALFVVLLIISLWVQRRVRSWGRARQGQIFLDKSRIPTIEERVQCNRAWVSGKIRSGGRGLMIVLWIAAIAWELTFGASFVNSLTNSEAQLGQRIALGVFSVLGLGIVFFALRVTFQRYRFGESWCHIRGKAGLLGEVMSGDIRTSKEIRPTGDYTFVLECLEIYSTGSGKNRKTKTKVHWQAKEVVPSAGTSSRAGIPFSFALPKTIPESGDLLSTGSINWQLRVSAPVDGVDYSSTFIVPVFLR